MQRRAHFSSQNERESESVRNKEIEFYSNLDDWWGPNCPQAQLHKFNEVRVNFVRKNVLQNYKNMNEDGKRQILDSQQIDIFNGMKVLDVGCGAGILAEGLGRLGMGSVTGIDPTPKCIELA